MTGRKTVLGSGWIAARSTEVNLSGVQLTTTHPPDTTAPAKPWVPAAVPGTVLGTLLKNKLIPDPFYGLNNKAIIDIANSGREYYTFWFFTSFTCNVAEKQHVDLSFRGINYSAEVYLNGHEMMLPKGMFRRHTLDVTDILITGANNLLAVLVHPPDHPGRIPPWGGQGGDHEIGKDVATQYVEGWDWIAPIRDRNTGIWDEVSISVTGPVKIGDSHLVSSFFDNFKRSYLHATIELQNKSAWPAECTVRFQVAAEVEENICLLEQLQQYEVTVPPQSVIEYTIPPLFFYKPNLWWPNGMGKQSLYSVDVHVDVKGFGESDSWQHLFGFRKIESSIDPSTGGRLFKVNGQPIFIRGGNWILSDGLLRLTRERYMADIKFHADMNFNMIRCWGGGLAERPEFYHFCDIYGILVWQEFWITGDVDGRGIPISNPDGPLDHGLFLLCAKDTVKLLRNHASLALWVGGNEQVPPADINNALKAALALHPLFTSVDTMRGTKESHLKDSTDPSLCLDGTRLYVQGSMWDGFADGKGDFTDGPYEIQNPENFFRDDFYRYGFNPEVGSVGMPVAATIRATMPPEGWQIPIFRKRLDGFIEEIPNPIWDYHKYIPYSKPGKVHDQIALYSLPTSLDDFCLKAQLVNYVQYRALLEGWTSQMWTKYTGVLIWKTQNPWTGLRGQFYDHLHDQTAGFYGCRSAAEPIHVQLNLLSYFIEVVNTTADQLSDVAVEISVWDLDGECPYYKVTEQISVPPKKVQQIIQMNYPQSKNAKTVYFLLLKLFRLSDKGVLSRSFYWLHLPGQDYKLLEQYKAKRIPLKVTSEVLVSGLSYNVKLSIENMSKNGTATSIRRHLDAYNGEDHNCVGRSGSEKHSIWGKILGRPSKGSPGVRLRTTEINGTSSGVSFFIQISVHSSAVKLGDFEDTRILPVHYSDNYFSLVPGERAAIDLSFEVPQGVVPKVLLRGWNYQESQAVV